MDFYAEVRAAYLTRQWWMIARRSSIWRCFIICRFGGKVAIAIEHMPISLSHFLTHADILVCIFGDVDRNLVQFGPHVVFTWKKEKGVIPFTCWVFKLILKVFQSFSISSTTSNCPSLQAIWNRVFLCCTVIRYPSVVCTYHYVMDPFRLIFFYKWKK